MIRHAMAVLQAAIEKGPARPLTPCEKLACRVLLSVVGKRSLVHFCGLIEDCNPLYRYSQLSMAYDAMERTVQRHFRTCS